MDIGSAFTFMFDDEGWIAKIAIGGGLILGGILLSPIIIGLALLFPIQGYMVEVLRNVRNSQPIPLPEWSDFGNLFRVGLIVFLISLVYSIPTLIFACLSAAVSIGMQEADPDLMAVLTTASICLSCIQIVLSLAAGVLIPAAIIRYAQYETFGSAFQFGEIFSFISSNIGDYIIVILLGWVAGFIAFFLGILLCGIGIVFTGFWSVLVNANLYGQLARKAEEEMI